MPTTHHSIASSKKNKRPRAMLLAVQPQLQSDEEHEASCEELERLAQTLGLDIVERCHQKRTIPSKSTYVGSGRLLELAKITGGPGTIPTHSEEEPEPVVKDPDAPQIDLVLVNDALGPRLERALEHALGVEILDRTGLILEIFERRARTHAARLEIEIARLQYELPRLRDRQSSRAREGGGGGRGERGDTIVAMGKQRIRARIAQLEEALETAREADSYRKARRGAISQVALVGYTNAGKSSLMRALSGSDVFVEDLLFATVGVTARQLSPPASPPLVLSDTVGFIQDLPHELVASFRSTLEEAADADLAMLVLDVSDVNWREHMELTLETLSSVEVDPLRIQVIFNKCDRLDAHEREALVEEYPRAWMVSAHDAESVAALRERLLARRASGLERETLLLPFEQGQLRAEIFTQADVSSEHHNEWGTCFTMHAGAAHLDRWRAILDEVVEREPLDEPERVLEYMWRRGVELVSEQPSLRADGERARVLRATDVEDREWEIEVLDVERSAERVRRAARAQRLLRDRVGVSLPEWSLQTADVVAGERLPGESLGADDVVTATCARDLGAFLAQLQDVPEQDVFTARLPMLELGEVKAAYRADLAAVRDVVSLSPGAVERWREWLDREEGWPEHVALSHGGLSRGCCRVGSEDAALVAVSGWGAVSWGDPGVDFAAILETFGPTVFDVVVTAFHHEGGRLWPEFESHVRALESFIPVRVAARLLKAGDGPSRDRAVAMLSHLMME